MRASRGLKTVALLFFVTLHQTKQQLIFITMHQTSFMPQTLRFRRFSRRKIAAFLSVGREVSIGHLSIPTADRQMLKSGKAKVFVFLFMSLFLVLEMAAAQDDEDSEIALAEAVVSAPVADIASSSLHTVQILTAEEIARMPVSSVHDVLQLLPGLDVRIRGGGGMQADLSMRGGSFDQVTILLNGIDITDAQTGHFNLDLPVDLSMVERIEVLQGTTLSQTGKPSFCGAINIVTGQRQGNRLRLATQAGQYGYLSGHAALSRQIGSWQWTTSVSATGSDGYMDNTDYLSENVFTQLRHKLIGQGSLNLQAGLQNKSFGANSFYSLRYPDQYEDSKTLFASAGLRQDYGHRLWQTDAWLRLHNDRFELFRQGRVASPAWYTAHNYHLTSSTGVKTSFTWLECFGKTSVGLDFRQDCIFSTVLGESLQKTLHAPFAPDSIRLDKGKLRSQTDFSVEQSLAGEQWSVSVGLSTYYNSMFGWGYGYSANVAWQTVPWGSLILNLGRSQRMPTFTDLYYQSATQIANPALKPEESLQFSLGYNLTYGPWQAALNLYARQGLQLIDWVRWPEEEKWRSVNHTRITALGAESHLCYRPVLLTAVDKLEASYAFCTLDKQAGNLLSMYALDYLHHKLTLEASVRLYRRLGLASTLTFRQRAGQYTDLAAVLHSYDPVWLLNVRLNWNDQNWSIALSADNLLDRRYFDYGGVLQPGRWIKAGLEARF